LVDDLSAGKYQDSLEHPDCWPRTIEITATTPPAPFEVQVRRRGSLVFDVRNADGLPVVDAPIELTCLEFATRVSLWVEQGLVVAPASLLTDPQGLLRIEGLPRGSYHWAMATRGGGRLQGICEVLPGRLVHVPVPVP
jgi:hypothetical protein